MTIQQKIIPPGSGKTFHVLGGDQITIKVSAEDTAGAFTVLETVTPPGAGPPAHVHSREDESFYILEGTFEFDIAGKTTRAEPGSLVIAPRNIPHRFQNLSDLPGKLLIVCQPGGFEKFVQEFATLPVDQPPDPEKMASLGQKFGIAFLPDTGR